MTDRKTSPLVKGVAWFFALCAVVIVWGIVSAEGDKAERAQAVAEQRRQSEVMAAEALALMTPEERDAVEASRKAEDEAEVQRSRDADAIAAASFECREAVRRSLHDPGSVEWDETPGWFGEVQADGVIRIQPRYRAKNRLGGVGHETVNCYVDNDKGTVRIAAL